MRALDDSNDNIRLPSADLSTGAAPLRHRLCLELRNQRLLTALPLLADSGGPIDRTDIRFAIRRQIV